MASSPVPVAMAHLLAIILLVSLAAAPMIAADTVVLTNYEFENRVPPNNTIVVAAAPSSNLSSSEFGTLRVVTNVLREAAAPDSRVLGSVVGLVNTLRDGSLFLTFNFVYETAERRGTIGVQGRLSAAGDGELVVTGGTGDFRKVSGYCETTLVTASDPASVVFKNVVYLDD